MARYIIHIDMDAFFAAIEQGDNPELKGQAVIIGGRERGVVSTASYEARVYGVHSAMPISHAKKLCPQGVFVLPRMARYLEVSRQVKAALQDFSPLVEMASVDEAYLDASGMDRVYGSVENMALLVQEAVATATGGLSCSCGVAPIKFLAKIASDVKKPKGIFCLHPPEVPAFLASLAVSKIPGVGKKFVQQLNMLGVKNGSDVLRFPRDFWERRFGKQGLSLHQRASGEDPRGVVPYTPPKSESAETTFAADSQDMEFLKTWLLRHAERVGASLRKHGFAGRFIHLKIKFSDFQQFTRQITLDERTSNTQTIFECACALLDAFWAEQKQKPAIRLIGLGVSGFEALPPRQLSLLDSASTKIPINNPRSEHLDKALDLVRSKYGNASLIRGRLFECAKNKD